jgi:hypothetical protein
MKRALKVLAISLPALAACLAARVTRMRKRPFHKFAQDSRELAMVRELGELEQ